ncbi:uroporphyrinogen decarboxylase [Candidatus Marinamargulisbacteria bacterium SCGC AAA071-K20]|nr:uroporphyrinogen decarboxylase [Candidatus Marinamargulisbacteria bacterium SCGC AAA071-K20]
MLELSLTLLIMIYLDALSCKKTERPPIWFMRQAGRYMQQYQDIRKNHNFLEMIGTPQLATEITLQPIDAFGFDAAILFSDILTLVKPFGCSLEFKEGIGPVIDDPLQAEAIKALEIPNIKQECGFVFEAVKLIREKLLPYKIPLIGFSGAPFTVASYMIEGKSSPNLETVKYWIGHNPNELHDLLEKLTVSVIDYLDEQVNAGVQALQLFDTWAGLLSYEDFKLFIAPYLKKIVSHVRTKHNVPITVFCKHTMAFLDLLIDINPNGISVDWQTNLRDIKSKVPSTMALQGNLDPLLLFAKPEKLRERVIEKLDIMKDRPGYIFNLGHGILPTTPVENVKLVVDTVKSYRG